MKVSFDVQNISDGDCPFSFVCVRIEDGKLVHSKVTDKSYTRGHREIFSFEWPFESFTPFNCAWKAMPEYARKWQINECFVDTPDGKRTLVQVVPCLF